MREYDVTDLMAGIKATREPVVLFGAGYLGRLARYALARYGVTAEFFCDGDLETHGNILDGLEVVAPERLDDLPAHTHVFICSDYISAMTEALTRLGFSNIYNCVALLESVEFDAAAVEMTDVHIERRIQLHKHQCQKVTDDGTAPLVLRSLDVVVTEACSMKCRDCANLMQYYAHPRHSDLDLLESAVERIMGAIDQIYEFRVLGGEPFVNRNVGRVLRQLTAYDHVDRLIIYTNATIVPREDALEAMRHPKVAVDITDYGDLSRNLEPFVAVLAENGIPYRIYQPTWTDSGRINYVERSPEVLDDMFRNCCVNDALTLLNGWLYRCPFSANATNLRAVPQRPDDAVDLTGDAGVEQVRQQIRRMYYRTTHISACEYCNGRDYRTAKIDRAIQVRRPLPLIPISSGR